MSAPPRAGASNPGIHQPMPERPQLERLANGHYRVLAPWTVQLGSKTWRIQKGYTSNGITAPASIKKSLGDGVQYKDTWAAVFHDWLFTQEGVSRNEADRAYYQLMLAYGIPEKKARMMYNTVSAYSVSKLFR